MLASGSASRTAASSAGGAPSGVLFFRCVGDQAEGAPGLPAGEQVRAVFPAGDDAQADAVGLGQAGEGLVHPGEVGGAVAGQGEQHAGQQGADQQLAGPDTGRQQCLDPRGGPGPADDLLQPLQRDWRAHRVPPGSATA